MYSSAEQVSAAEQAGKALMSVAWETRKQQKQQLSAKCRASSHPKKRRSTVKLDRQIRNACSSLAKCADGALDRFVARVEAICKRGDAEELLKKIDAILPDERPRKQAKSASL